MGHYVYQFLNENNEIIYIGKTESLKKRLTQQHFSINGHLNVNAYFETCKILVAPLISHEEMDIYERYLINIYTPKYNKMMNNGDSFRFELPELTWVEVPFDKPKFTEKYFAQVGRKLAKEIKDDSPIYPYKMVQMRDQEANIEVLKKEFGKYGYQVLRNHDTSIQKLQLKRNKSYNKRDEANRDIHPFCRYIVVNHEKFFCISDIEGVIHNLLNTNEQTRALIDKGEIEPDDVLILQDETLYERLHVCTKTSLRFGSSQWLAKRILRQLNLNRRSGWLQSMKNGWTEELVYLAEILSEDKKKNKEDIFKPSGVAA